MKLSEPIIFLVKERKILSDKRHKCQTEKKN